MSSPLVSSLSQLSSLVLTSARFPLSHTSFSSSASLSSPLSPSALPPLPFSVFISSSLRLLLLSTLINVPWHFSVLSLFFLSQLALLLFKYFIALAFANLFLLLMFNTFSYCLMCVLCVSSKCFVGLCCCL